MIRDKGVHLLEAVFLLFFAFLLWNGFPAAYFVSDTGLGGKATWYELVHLSTNSIHFWRYSPLVVGVLESVFGSQVDPALVYVGFSAVLFATGLFLLLRLLTKERQPKSFGFLLLVLLLLVLFGRDPVLFPTISWFPWLVAALYWALSSTKRFYLRLAVVLGVSVILVSFGNQLSSILAVLAALVCAISIPAKHENAGRYMLLGLAIFLPAVCHLTFIPAPSLPHYPKFAEVVTDDLIPWMLTPRFGPSSPLMLIERDYLREVFGGLSVALCVLSVLGVLSARVESEGMSRKFFWSALLCFSLIAFDSVLPERFVQITPLSTFLRLVPHLFFFALSPLVLCVGCIAFFLASEIAGKRLLTLSLFLTTLSVPLIFAGNQIGSRLEAGLLLADSGKSLMQTLSRMEASGRFSSDDLRGYREILLSPSLQVVRREGIYLLTKRRAIEEAKFRSAGIFGASFRASPNWSSEQGSVLVDGDPKSAWSTGATQVGNEWIFAKFSREIAISGLELDVGEAHPDFPRGLRVSRCGACDPLKDEIPPSNCETILELPRWEGEIRYTEEGYPYYGAQDVVRVFFPGSVELQCVLVEQIYPSFPYYWTVAEFRILLDDRSSLN